MQAVVYRSCDAMVAKERRLLFSWSAWFNKSVSNYIAASCIGPQLITACQPA